MILVCMYICVYISVRLRAIIVIYIHIYIYIYIGAPARHYSHANCKSTYPNQAGFHMFMHTLSANATYPTPRALGLFEHWMSFCIFAYVHARRALRDCNVYVCIGAHARLAGYRHNTVHSHVLLIVSMNAA